MKIRIFIKMFKNAVFGDGSMENFTKEERREITEYIEKRKPKLDRFAKKLDITGYKMYKSKYWRTVWKNLYGTTDDLDKFGKEYEKKNKITG